MYERILGHMREKIGAHEYVMTLHAEEEMDEDGLAIYDVENAILTGSIVERQRDQNTAEWKYCVVGQTVDGERIEVVAKLGAMGRLVIITVYIL